MFRIFLALAWFAALMLAATFVLGLTLGDFRQNNEAAVWLRVHWLFGLATSLLVVFVNSVVVTYFIGTSRWCREVVETYHLDAEYLRRSSHLKRTTFPWSVVAMLVIVGVIALGAAADPGTGRPNTEAWAVPHLIGSIAGLAFITWSFLVQAVRIQTNQALINEVVAEVRRIREKRGLPV